MPDRAALVTRRRKAGRRARRSGARTVARRGTLHRPTDRQLVYLRAVAGLGQRCTVQMLAARVGVAPRTARVNVAALEAGGWVTTMRLRRPLWVRITDVGLLAVVQIDARAFVDEMAAQGIHVGIGSPPNCPTCRTGYPCSKARQS